MKQGTPKGTRDFSPQEMVKRNYIFDTIKLVFQRYGYLPIETPAMENLSTLMGKYGEEGDKLIFKILNSGDYLSAVNPDLFEKVQAKSLEPKINEKGEQVGLIIRPENTKTQNEFTSKISEKALNCSFRTLRCSTPERNNISI